MTKPDRGGSALQSLYATAIRLYPPRFRDQYGPLMRQALRDALADRTLSRRAVVRLLFHDFATSLIQEHLAMLSDTFSRPILAFNALMLAGIATVLALFLYAIPQQVLRQGANDPQLQLAGDLAARLEQGVAPADAVPPGQVDLARSLAPFVIVYDDRGVPIASQAQLNGKPPSPPQGVFNYVRSHGEDTISWKPVLGGAHGLRIAAVIQRVQHVGTGGAGFVLAGRSLAEVQARIDQVASMARLAWIAMLGLIAMGTIGFGWITRKAAV